MKQARKLVKAFVILQHSFAQLAALQLLIICIYSVRNYLNALYFDTMHLTDAFICWLCKHFIYALALSIYLKFYIKSHIQYFSKINDINESYK